MDKIKIAAVSYLNTKPFIYGLAHSNIITEIEIEMCTPAECAERLRTNKADIGLIPVATIPEINNAQIISEFCIGASKPVKSVLILSEVPIHEIKTLMLDYQSRTSVQLARVLFKFYWKLNPEFVKADLDFESKITGTNAAVVIGDRALLMRYQFPYCYDLSACWFEFTQLPFVFACWVSNKPLPQEFISKLNIALAEGLNQIDEVVEQLKTGINFYPDTEDYLKNCLDYNFDDAKKKALELFLKYSSLIG